MIGSTRNRWTAASQRAVGRDAGLFPEHGLENQLERRRRGGVHRRGGAVCSRRSRANLLGVQLAGKVLKWQPGEASIIGWLLQTKALIMIIFITILLDKGIITSETFTALLLMAVASTMLTVPVVSPKLQRLKSIVTQAA